MPTLSDERIAQLIGPYLPAAPTLLVSKLSLYLDLLMKWNARTNLTAIREPEEIVRRHFGESLFAGLHLPDVQSILDFGSGAGFPGLPIQLLHPQLSMTLGESQNKKVAFLREAVRTLGVQTDVWADRIEAMPPDRYFDLVIMRAVDRMPVALVAAAARSSKYLAVLTTEEAMVDIPGFSRVEIAPLPESEGQVFLLLSQDSES